MREGQSGLDKLRGPGPLPTATNSAGLDPGAFLGVGLAMKGLFVRWLEMVLSTWGILGFPGEFKVNPVFSSGSSPQFRFRDVTVSIFPPARFLLVNQSAPCLVVRGRSRECFRTDPAFESCLESAFCSALASCWNVVLGDCCSPLTDFPAWEEGLV